MLKASEADVFGFQECGRSARCMMLRRGRDAGRLRVCRPGRDRCRQASGGDGRAQGDDPVRGKAPDDPSFWITDFPAGAVFRKRRTIEQVSVDIDAFSRPVLNALVKPEKGDATRVMVAHLKSKRPMNLDMQERDNPDIEPHANAIGQALASIRRTAEAAALRVVLNESMEDNQTPHVVMGDLNNGSLSVSTGIITGDPRYRLIESSRTVSGKRADKGLYSAETLMHLRTQGHTNYTHIYENKLEVLDHILVSEEFYDHSPNRVWSFRHAEIFNDYLTLAHKRKDIEKALEADKKAMWPTDHGIARAIFEHRPFK